MKLLLKTPINGDSMRFFNGSIVQEHIDYRFKISWDDLMLLETMPGGERLSMYSSIAEILRVVGSDCTLCIGDCKGVIAPPGVEPQGWTFGRGYPSVPREYFWLWYPNDEAQAKMLAQEPAFLEEPTSIFKSLVPHQLRKTHGELLGIDAIPVLRLPGLIRKELDWVFEFE